MTQLSKQAALTERCLAMCECAAVNEDCFFPPVLSDPECMSWVTRTALRLANNPPGSTDVRVRNAIFAEGTPDPMWAQALAFMGTLSRANNQNRLSLVPAPVLMLASADVCAGGGRSGLQTGGKSDALIDLALAANEGRFLKRQKGRSKLTTTRGSLHD